MNIIGEYINFKLKSKGKHKIHSPFVFDFVTKCLTLKIPLAHQEELQQLRRRLQKNQTSIQFFDAGAGSKKLGPERKISAIYANSSSKGKYGKLLYRVAAFYQAKNILELGTSLGVGTSNLALASKESSILTIDACKEVQDAAKFAAPSSTANVCYLHQTFEDFFKKTTNDKYDLVFIDGHHDGQALLNYFEKVLPNLHPDSLVILDDIRWSDSMFEAWNTLVKDPRVHLSLDLFKMGIIALRPGQAKEHFMIRY